MIDVVQYSLNIRELGALQVDQGVTVGIILQNPLEERRACSQDHLLSLNLIVNSGESHISEVIFILEVVEGAADVHFKVTPAETKLFMGTPILSFLPWRCFSMLKLLKNSFLSLEVSSSRLSLFV